MKMHRLSTEVCRYKRAADMPINKSDLSTEAFAVPQSTRPQPELVPDCLEHIFTFLSQEDKGRVAQVSRLWKSICYRVKVWKNETASVRLSERTTTATLRLSSIHRRGIRKLRIKDHRGNLHLLQMFAATIKSLDISGCHYTTDEMLTSLFDLKEEKSYPELESLSLNYCSKITKDGLQAALEKTPNLRALNIKGCNLVMPSEIVHATSEENDDAGSSSSSSNLCRHLEHLSIAGCKLISGSDLTAFFQITGAKELKSLDMQDCDHMCDCSMEALSKMNLQHLEYLNLSFCVSISDEALLAIANGIPSLKTLLLQSVDNVTNFGISQVMNKCSELQSLNISHCSWVDDETMEGISQAKIPSSLEELDISCADITDKGVKSIAENHHRLKHLKIGQCRRLSDLSLMYIGYHTSDLESIDIYGCSFSARAINSIWDTLPSLRKVNLNMIS